jgi:hypothetical protein
LIIYSAFVKYLEKWEYNETVHRLFIAFKKAYDSVKREVLYNILIELSISMKPVRPIRICSNETYSRVRVSKHFTDTLVIMNSLKKGDALLPLLFNFAVKYAFRSVQVNQDGLKLKGKISLLLMVWN